LAAILVIIEVPDFEITAPFDKTEDDPMKTLVTLDIKNESPDINV